MRRALRSLLLAIAVLVVVVVVAPATPPGHMIVAGLIERAASANGLTVMIDRLSGWPPFWVGARRILVSDSDGTFAEIDNLSADLNTISLLFGRLSFGELKADRVAIARQPNLPGSGQAAGLPFVADSFSVARLELGEELVGNPAVLAVAGTLNASGGAIDARLNAERIDRATGSLAAKITRPDAATPLTVDVQLSEGVNGILAGLTGHTEAPAYSLTAETSVADAGFSGTLNLKSQGQAHFDGNFALSHSDGNGDRLTLAGNGELSGLLPADYADLLAGEINVVVDADWDQQAAGALPHITVRRGLLTTGTVRAEASGNVSDSASNLSLTVEIAKADGGTVALPLSLEAGLERATLTGKIAPSGNALRLEVTGNVTALAIGDTKVPNLGLSLAAEAAGDHPLSAKAVPFALRVEPDAIETPTGRVAATADAPLLFTADGTLDTATLAAKVTARLAAAGGQITFDGTAAAESAVGQVRLNVPDLKRLAPLAGQPIAGSIKGSADGSLVGPVDLSFDVTATDLDTGDANLARLLAGDTRITGRLSESDGALAFSEIEIRGAAIAATAEGKIDAENLQATVDGTLSDLSRLAESSSGQATFHAKVLGAPKRPAVDATVEIANGRLLDKPLEGAQVHFAGAPSNGTWRGNVTISGDLAGKPLGGGAEASVDPDSGQFALPNVNLNVGGNQVTGALERTPEGALSGTLTIDAPDIQALAALALVEAQGSAAGEARFIPDGKRQTLSLSFTANDIAVSGLTAGNASGEVRIGDLFGTPLVEGEVTASAVTAGGQKIDTAHLTATVENGATQFRLNADGNALNIASTGTFSRSGDANVVRIDTLNGTAFRVPLQLSAPVTIRMGQAEAGTVNATLAVGGGKVQIDGRVSPELNLTVTADAVSATLANALVPSLGAEGSVTGQATITGTPDDPRFAWRANWSGMRVAATRNAGLPGLELAARGDGTKTATSLDATLSGAGLSLAIKGNVPFSGPGLAVQAEGNAPLSLIALETSREVRVAGTARVALNVTGSVAAYRIAGTADLNDATLVDADTGAGLVGGNGHITLDGDRATTSGIKGRLTQGGDVTVAGSLSFGAPGLPADLTLRVVNGRYADGNVVNAAFNADLTLKGPVLGNGTLAGRIDLARTEIQLPDKFGSASTAIDVRHVHTEPGFRAPKLRSTAARSTSNAIGSLRLDIAMTATSAVYVRGFGIDAELGGSLRLAGTSGDPQAIGGLKMRRGRIETLGRRFDFDRGTLTFAGDLMPVVDFSGTTTTTEATVTLTVSGPANDPVISFTSNPDLPEEEILSNLLFDRSVGSLSPVQAAQLVDAVAQLTGALGGTGLFARVRQATGLDDLDIQQTETGGTTVGIGKRINENVRLGFEAGTEADAGRVTIDLDLTDTLKARASAGQDGSGKIGLSYEREY